MAEIAASDLTYTVNQRDLAYVNGKIQGKASIAFGDGALTYPTGGVPLTKGKLGVPGGIDWLSIVESNSSGYKFEYDVSAEKLIMLQTPELIIDDTVDIDAAPLEILGAADAPAALVLVVRFEGRR